MSTAQIIPFEFDAHEVRTLLIDDQPWFCAADVCDALGYANSRKAISDHCREAGVTSRYIRSGGQQRKLTFIDEGNLYRLIIKSRKPEAQRFESWVCDEVLPSIRRHGHYHDTENKLGTLVGQTIGTDGFHCLGAVLDGKVRHLPAPVRKRAKMHIWSQVHKAYSVVSAQDIPADQLDSARNFIASYVLEGEWLEAERLSDGELFGNEDMSHLYVLLCHAHTLCQLWQEYRIDEALRYLQSPAAGRMQEHVSDIRRLKSMIVRRKGESMVTVRQHLGLSSFHIPD